MKTTREVVAGDLRTEKLRIENKIIKKKYKELMTDNRRLEALLNSCETDAVKPFEIRVNKNSTSEAVAFILLSDWHVDEVVKAVSVNGYNRFNPEVAHSRIVKCFQNALRLIQLSKQESKINEVFVVLAGDFISSNIHEELLENTSMLPMDAMLFAQDHIVSGINFLLDNTDVKINVVCAVGNHSRITEKVHNSSEHGNSLEYYMYHNIARFFALNKRLTFQMDKSYHQYIRVYGRLIRVHHGHAITYGGGIGGITIPINKAISQWNKLKNVYLDIFGHFHQYVDGGNFVTNNSLIGYNSYALKIKASPSRPAQTFFLVHKKYGKIMSTPIHVD